MTSIDVLNLLPTVFLLESFSNLIAFLILTTCAFMQTTSVRHGSFFSFFLWLRSEHRSWSSVILCICLYIVLYTEADL